MKRLVELMNAALDTVLPRRERRMRTESRTMEDVPLSPTPHNVLGVRIITIMEYQNKAVQDLIRSLKYDGSAHAARLAAGLLADYLREEFSTHKTFSTRSILLVPVPLHPTRQRERGWNQIALVLSHLPRSFLESSAVRVAHDAIVRTRDTKAQTRLSRSDRLSNVAGAFHCPHPESVTNAHVYLIDDVTTTGATLANAATPLRRAGAHVTLLALSRA